LVLQCRTVPLGLHAVAVEGQDDPGVMVALNRK
jgi:hypothetical protein